MSIRILLVDNHQMFREGLRAILERDKEMEVIGESADGREAVEMATGPQAPEVVVMDVSMPGLNGIEATRQIFAKRPNMKVIALSAHADRRFVTAMLEAGACAYVLKDAAGDEILQAVHTVHAARKYLSPAIAGVVIDGYLSKQTSPKPAHTSPLAAREREVVQLLAEGKTSKDVAKVLHLSVKTVETHRRNIMHKLKLQSIAALTKFAIREGLTSVEE